jgi:Protein of unknown function (DUF1275)
MQRPSIAVAMGLHNATARQLAVPNLTATVLTLALTGVAADSTLAGGHNPWLGWRLAAVLSIFAGSAVGAVFVSWGGLPLPLAVKRYLLCLLPCQPRAQSSVGSRRSKA